MRVRAQRAERRGERPHPTAMIERPGPFLRWFYRQFFGPIEFPPALAERIRGATERGTVVYVLKTLSYIDYLYFSYALLAHGLPLARFANGIRTIFWQPIWKLIGGVLRLWRERRHSSTDELAEVVERGDSALLFLRRPRTLFGWEPSGFRGEYVEELIRLGRARLEAGGRPIIFVPLVLLWGSPAVRAARAQRGLLDRVFGEREAPGRLRSIWTFWRHYGDSQVQVGEPLDLAEVLKAQGADVPDEVLARRVRWRLGGRLEAEVRVVLGPARKTVGRITDEVLRTRKLVAEAQRIAADEGVALAAIERRARSQLREIAADPKPWVFRLMRPLLAWVWRKIFDGIEVDAAGIERVREAARQGPLILVPSHKSHIDYLVLSYVFLAHDLVPPHIAAGANLSFWPLGFFFRRAGAFFLRRSFRGDRLYGAVFRAYVRKLVREGNNIEFFIEGSRSRTGKLLAPKLGLLGMIADAALEDDGARARKAQIVPISIGYEKVIEEKSYAREAAGGEKRKEDVKGLLKATRVLRGQYGRLNIQFDEPFSLGATLRDSGALVAWDEEENIVVPADESARRQATLRLGHRIVYGINRVTAVTPTALAATALLSSGRRGILRRELLDQAAFLAGRAHAAGGRLSETVYDSARQRIRAFALDRALDLLAHDGDLEVRSGGSQERESDREDPEEAGGRPLDEIYTVPDERRSRLAYYRNNAIHLYVADALVALALVGVPEGRPLAELRERTLGLSRLLKLEFTYRVGELFETIFERTLAGLAEGELVSIDGDRALPAAGRQERLFSLGGLVEDFVESYLVAARGLELHAATPIADRELERRIAELGDKLFFTGQVRRRESCVRANYHNALAYFKERKILVEEDRKLRLAAGIDPRALVTEITELLPPTAART